MFTVTTTIDVTDLKNGQRPVLGHRLTRSGHRLFVELDERRSTPWGAALAARRQRKLGHASTWKRGCQS